MAATIFRYDNAGRTIGILPYDSATHTEALDGTDKLVVVSEDSPTKRDRLVWQDESGLWHEHMVDATRRTHAAGGARTESTCSNSVNELYGVIVNWTKIRTRIEDVIATILSGTTWYIGDCSNFGVVEMELYHKSARECLAELCELVHGELETFITVGNSGVTRRYLRIVRERGRKSVMRQFQYSRNISSIVREVTSDEVYTAVKGYGAKLVEYDTNEYPTRLEATVNSNMDLTRWGVPMGNGTFAHNYTTYTDAQCTDRTFLTKQCQSILSSVSKPLVRYEFDTVDAGDGLWSDVRLGDKVMCIDEQFNPSLELIERVSEIRRNLKGRMQCRIVIGARTNPLVDKFKAAEKVNKKSTGNLSRITAASPVSTLGAGFDGEGAAGIGDVPTPTSIEPSRISVTTPPNKTTYYKNEKIDFTGIVVTLYNSDNSVYTDEWHPDGVAAFEELIFPIDVAGIGGSGGGVPSYQATSDLELPAGWTQPITAYGGMKREYTNKSFGVKGITHYETWTPIGNTVILFTFNDNKDAKFCIASDTPGDVCLIERWGVDNDTGEVRPKDTSYFNAYLSFTHNDQTVYYVQGTAGAYNFFYDKWDPQVERGTVTNYPGKEGAWTAIFGDRGDMSNEQIEVQWQNPNSGVTLSSSFGIVVKKHEFYGEAWGGGEDDNFSTSEGGKF